MEQMGDSRLDTHLSRRISRDNWNSLLNLYKIFLETTDQNPILLTETQD